MRKDGNGHGLSDHVPTNERGCDESSFITTFKHERAYAAEDELTETNVVGSEAHVGVLNNFKSIPCPRLEASLLRLSSFPFESFIYAGS